MTMNPYSSPQAAGQVAPRTPSAWGPRLIHVLLAISVIGILVALLLPARRGAGEAARRTQCNNNLKQIGLAMQNYLHLHGSFPPAYIVDAEGKPMHSWRVLILPYMEQKSLYDAYDQNEPWDSEVNRGLLAKMPPTYQCPSSYPWGENTSYVVIQGKQTVFDADTPCHVSAITDGLANTILVVEAPHANIPWTEPRDLSFAELSNSGVKSPHSDHPGVMLALLADGSVRQLQSNISLHDLRVLLTKDGRDTVSSSF